MSLEIEGLEQIKLMLRRASDLPVEMNVELRALAEETKTLAKYMAPEEYGDLKDAIQLRETAANTGGRFKSGMRNYEIYINNDHPVSAEREKRNHIETVGEYAWMVHEYMGWRGHPGAPTKYGTFEPSAFSIQMGESHGVDAGGRFMERAGEEIRVKMNEKLGALAFRVIESLDL